MQSRAKEYRTNAALCEMHAAAVLDPMKQFYQALELQWEGLARLAEREALNSEMKKREEQFVTERKTSVRPPSNINASGTRIDLIRL